MWTVDCWLFAGARQARTEHTARAPLSQRHFHWENRGQKARGPRRSENPPQSDPVFVNARLRLSAYRERPVYLDAHAHRTVTRTRHRSLPLLLSAHYSTAVRNQETCDDTFPTLPLYSRSPCTPFDFTVSHCWERANE